MNKRWVIGLLAGLAVSSGCKKGEQRSVKVDGSSTVFPIMEAVAEEFQREHRDIRVTVGVSGTGGGFKKFCKGEIDISDASRPIKPSEVELCRSHGVEYIELPIAYDGIAIVVHPGNGFASTMTVDELKKLWAPEAQGAITRWSQIREGWPDQEIRLFGAGVDSGTYDYFTEAIVGKEHSSRGDYTSSEDDNVVVQGVSRDPNALGFFGYAYYAENADKLKLVAVDDGDESNGAGAIAPSPETIANGTYQPLSRPIFVYVATKALDRPEVANFVQFMNAHAKNLVNEVGYIPLPDSVYEAVQARVEQRKTGSMFGGEGSRVGVSMEALLSGEGDAP